MSKILAAKGKKFGDKQYDIRAIKLDTDTIYVSWRTSWKFKGQNLTTEQYRMLPELPGWKDQVKALNADLDKWVNRQYREDLETDES